jgi:hypothetical protein
MKENVFLADLKCEKEGKGAVLPCFLG